jgi:hypothetical protein
MLTGRSLSLKQSEFWPLEANDVGLALEEFKAGSIGRGDDSHSSLYDKTVSRVSVHRRALL